MNIRHWLAAGALVCAAAAQAQTVKNAEDPAAARAQAPASDATHERSPTLNNSANRATDPTGKATEEFDAVRGGPATAKKNWKKGDPRGKPQHPRVSRKHVQEKLREQEKAVQK